MRNITIFLLLFFLSTRLFANAEDLHSNSSELQIAKENLKVIKISGFQITLLPETVLQIVKNVDVVTVKLISGQIFVLLDGEQNKKLPKVYFDGNYFLTRLSSLVFFSKSKEKIEVLNFSRNLIELSLKDQQSHIILPGFKNWFSGFNNLKQNAVGLPRTIDPLEGVLVLSRVYQDKALLTQAAADFRKIWQVALQSEAKLNQDQVRRVIASVENEKKIKLQRVQQQKVLEQKRRQQYFINTFSK